MNIADRRSLGEPRGGRSRDQAASIRIDDSALQTCRVTATTGFVFQALQGFSVRACSHCWNPGQAPFGYKPGFMERFCLRSFLRLQEVIEDVTILDQRRG